MKKTIIGIALIVISLGGIIAWEMFGREAVMMSEVLVFNQNVQEGTVITQDMLSVKEVIDPIDGALTVNDATSLIGMAASQYIPFKAELVSEYFEDPTLSVNSAADEYIYTITTSLVKTLPQSVKKGDTVYLYYDGELLVKAPIISVKDSSGQVITYDAYGNASGTVAILELKVNSQSVTLLSQVAEDGLTVTAVYQ